MLGAARCPPEAVLGHVPRAGHAIVGLGNSEPWSVVDAIEAGAERFEDLRLHQLLTLRGRPSVEGELPGVRHVSWFLGPRDRDAFHRGACDLVPASFSDIPRPPAGARPSGRSSSSPPASPAPSTG